MAEHRLLAVLAADAVGFSLLGAHDAQLAMDSIDRARAVFAEAARAYGGRLVDSPGDFILQTFPAASAAVAAAVQAQQQLRLASGLQFRIGLHLGDVLRKPDGSIYGDGVNIAARLQALCDVGQIRASEAVRSAASARLRPSFRQEMVQELKNIPEPVKSWAVDPSDATLERLFHDLALTAAAEVAADTETLLQKPALAVLPLVNVGGAPDDEYFSDGLTDDIITAVSRWKAFPVLARTSTFTYKGKAIDARLVARELGARYVLEGSVRRAGERLRVSVQLIDAETGHQVWSERLDRRIEDIFDLQDEIAAQIASTVEPAIEKAEAHRSHRTRKTNLTTWDLYQRGNAVRNQFTRESAPRARQFFEQAAEADPTYAPAFVGIARTHFIEIMLGVVQNQRQAVQAAYQAALTAVDLDSTDSTAHQSLGIAYLWMGDHERAVAEELAAVRHNPSDSWARIGCGNVLDVAGRPEEGIPQLETGIRLNPLNPRMGQAMTWLGGAFLNSRRYPKALECLDKTLLNDSSYPLTHLFRAVTLAHLGSGDAQRALSEVERLSPGFTAKFVSWRAYKRDEDNRHMVEGLIKAGYHLPAE